MNDERPLTASKISELMLEVITNREFCREVTGGYDFFNAGGAHQDNLFWLVEKLANQKGLLQEDIRISKSAWGAPRSLLHEGYNTNFTRDEIARLGQAFQRLINNNVLAPGMTGSSDSFPFFNVASEEDNIYLSLLNEKFWELIHPQIVEVSKARYQSGQFADSVEAAFKHVNVVVKKIYKSINNGEELDGRDLMFKAFDLKNPQIILSDYLSSDSEKSIQEGYKHIFGGAMQAIRNPKAHDNITITRERAIHFLFLASLLMHKIDERIAPA